MKNRVSPGYRNISVAFLLVIGPSITATATDLLSPVENVLSNVGETSPQRSFGRLIEDVCPGTLIPQNQFDLDSNSDLKKRCDEMWANALIGQDVSGAIDGLQATASEEDAAIASIEVDASSTDTSRINNRLSSVRGGSTSGIALTLNGLGHNANSQFSPALGAGDSTSPSNWGAFFAGNFNHADRDTTDRETGFKSDTWGFTGGVDYTFTERGMLGLAFGYSDSDTDLAQNSGKLESDSWSIYGYGSYSPGMGGYFDFTLGYSESSHDQDRNVSYTIQQINVAPALAGMGPPVPLTAFTTVNQTAMSSTDSDEFSISAVYGYDWQSDRVTFGPYIGISYADIEIEGFREQMSQPTAAGSGLALFIDKQEFESVITTIGGAATFNFEGPWGPVFPYLKMEYLHEYKNGNDAITGGFIDDPNGLKFSLATDAPDRNYFNFGAGFSAELSENSYFYTRYDGLVGYEDLSVHAVEFGVSLGF